MLAVLKAGGAFVPLDPSHPIERLRALCDSTRAELLLCSRCHEQMLTSVSDKVLPVDETSTAKLDEATGHVTGIPAVSSTNAAYVIFTSGSTGKPKVRT